MTRLVVITGHIKPTPTDIRYPYFLLSRERGGGTGENRQFAANDKFKRQGEQQCREKCLHVLNIQSFFIVPCHLLKTTDQDRIASIFSTFASIIILISRDINYKREVFSYAYKI